MAKSMQLSKDSAPGKTLLVGGSLAGPVVGEADSLRLRNKVAILRSGGQDEREADSLEPTHPACGASALGVESEP